ncbi:VOC family protein [uncultured Roseivirga sp.]|uniref:VOC family protein n=1 Tax=uncultured Roseivirga sp. TaxID=543088 RepID=UPI000D7B8313|nr:VOC family protein [uncultured Roseivirga sp.]PWL32051.1 MAG: VOC family protein [Roseivirga sp. XM-24bin3]
MTTINIYLTFNGNCKTAFDFYRSVFGGDFASESTFGEMPPQEGMPPVSDEMKNQIMHVSLPISKETVLMGSDTGGEWAADYQQGNNFSISITTDSKEKADNFFNKLQEGGEAKMPMEQTFWGDYFGMLTDQFGINWMISFNDQQ